MTVVWILLLAVLSGILYRLGGAAKRGDFWDFLRASWVRDCGCSAVTTAAIGLWIGWDAQWWVWVLHFGLLWGALSTYWDFLNHDQEVWWTWMITGFFYGLAVLPFAACSQVAWWPFIGRCIALSVTTMAWRMFKRPGDLPDDVLDEFGVGFLLTISVMLL